jgi:S-adenosylmethionine:tRNA ribosyltransferase-isomerase
MRIDEFDYDLPAHLIAQEPCPERDQARLLVIRRETKTIEHHIFQKLPDLLVPGDLLVLNDTRVVPARLVGRRARTGGRWEGLFLRELPNRDWEILSKSRGKLTSGETILVDPGTLQLRLLEKTREGHWLVQPRSTHSPLWGEPQVTGRGEGEGEVGALELLGRYGQVPLPPYIRKGAAVAADRERYQTVFARQPGAVAAPTAGLHFTPTVFDRLRQRDIQWVFVTLHVGLGTFQPIQTEEVNQHRMHREWGELSDSAAAAIRVCRQKGGRIVAVGTTSVRVLETVAALGPLRAWRGETELFIYPPFQFRAVDALITNFHLPRSTLLLLVSAFAGMELIRQAYQEAIARQYRFYSYGDAMLIL